MLNKILGKRASGGSLIKGRKLHVMKSSNKLKLKRRAKLTYSGNQYNMSEDNEKNEEDEENENEEEDKLVREGQMPNKRRHVSSISKAMLAKKILSKIESENNPSANVV